MKTVVGKTLARDLKGRLEHRPVEFFDAIRKSVSLELRWVSLHSDVQRARKKNIGSILRGLEKNTTTWHDQLRVLSDTCYNDSFKNEFIHVFGTDA